MRKVVSIILLIVGVLFAGCSVPSRSASNVIKVDEQNDISIKVISTAGVRGDAFGYKKGEVGLNLIIKNETSEVKYLNWSSSSIGYNGVTSRVVTGNDRLVNINSMVPNTALMPNRETAVTIYAADFINIGYYKTSSYYYTENPIKSDVELIVSYSGKNINELKQAIYQIKIDDITK